MLIRFPKKIGVYIYAKGIYGDYGGRMSEDGLKNAHEWFVENWEYIERCAEF